MNATAARTTIGTLDQTHKGFTVWVNDGRHGTLDQTSRFGERVGLWLEHRDGTSAGLEELPVRPGSVLCGIFAPDEPVWVTAPGVDLDDWLETRIREHLGSAVYEATLADLEASLEYFLDDDGSSQWIGELASRTSQQARLMLHRAHWNHLKTGDLPAAAPGLKAA